MNADIYLPLAIPAVAALTARPLADRLPPAAATWLLTVSALALALASSAVLGLLALYALVRVPSIAAVGDLSVSAIRAGDPVSLPVAIVAGGLLAAAAAAAVRVAWGRGTAIVAAHRHARSLPGTGQVVVTEDAAADAYTVPGWPCRIVITAGMLRALSGQERTVLLAHERAHASGSHYLFTSVARLAAAVNPLLRPVAAEVGYTVERWADERAAAESGDRPLAARAVARAALAASAARIGRADPLIALGMASSTTPGVESGRPSGLAPGTPPGTESGRPSGLAPGTPPGTESIRASAPAALRGAGPVPRRVAALLAPPPRTSLLLYAAVLLVVAASALSAVDAAAGLHQLIELAQAPSA